MKEIGITVTEKEVVCEALANCVDAITMTLNEFDEDAGKHGLDEVLQFCELLHKRDVMLSVLDKLCNEHDD